MSLKSTTNDTLTAYGIWEDMQLTHLVVSNSQIYPGEDDKPSIDVHLGGLCADCPPKMKLLKSNNTTSHTGL